MSRCCKQESFSSDIFIWNNEGTSSRRNELTVIGNNCSQTADKSQVEKVLMGIKVLCKMISQVLSAAKISYFKYLQVFMGGDKAENINNFSFSRFLHIEISPFAGHSVEFVNIFFWRKGEASFNKFLHSTSSIGFYSVGCEVPLTFFSNK